MPETADPNPFSNAPLDEDTLCALVEGDLDPEAAEAAHETLLSADPDLAQLVEMMSRDRVMVRTIGDETPPPGLDEVIIGRLEREVLLGLRSGEPGTRSLPVSQVGRERHRHQRGGTRWLQRPAGAGLAAAALLVLAVGVVLQMLPARPQQPLVSPLAQGDTQADAAAEMVTPTAVAGDRPTPPTDPAVVPERVSPGPGTRLAGELADGEIFTGDWDRALALLDEGRLLIRVRSASPEATHARLVPLRERAPRAGQAWRLEEEVDPALAIAMQEKFAMPVADTGPLAIAADDTPARLMVEPLDPPRTVLEGVYLVDARRDSSAIASLNAALSLGDGQVAVFEALPEPLELPAVLTPDAVLWWARPASSWSERRYLPVVIERVER